MYKQKLKMKVCYIFRQKEKNGNSIENVFLTINSAIQKSDIETEVYFRNKSLWRSLLELRKLNADIYHITGDVYYLALFLPRKKTTITVHDIGAFKNNAKTVKQYVYAFIWFILPILWVKKITVISDFVKYDLIQYFKINPKKICIIENPISLELQFEKHEINSCKPNILQIGTGWHKNLIGLIEAVKEVNCTLTIIGEPSRDLVNKMEGYAIDFAIHSNISNEAVMNLYSKCDLVYFASFSEGFGLPILEAQAIGRPVITSNLSPMNDTAGIGAILVNPSSFEEIKQVIQNLICDNKLYSDCVEKGQINLKKYNPNLVSQKYYQFYKNFNS